MSNAAAAVKPAKEAPAPDPAQDPRVQAAERALERARKTEEDLIAEYEAAVEAMEIAEGTIGERLLQAHQDSGDPEKINREHTAIWLRVDTSRKATRAARRARVMAEAALAEAQGMVAQDESEHIREALMQHTKKIMEHLQAITTLDEYPHQLTPPAVVHMGYRGPVSRSWQMEEAHRLATNRARSFMEQAARLRSVADIDPTA